jgi:hypothetical protein
LIILHNSYVLSVPLKPKVTFFVTDWSHLCSLLVDYTTSERVEKWKGYLYAILLFASTVLNTVFLQQLYQISYTVGLRVKAAVVSMVYRKVGITSVQ